jgi:hypothetical protein
MVPLLDKKAIDLMLGSLSARNQELWNELGANWRISMEQWPTSNPLPEYELIFIDGCIPSKIHNLSDRPANFPTLDTLPRERRGPNYSDAYDSRDEQGASSRRVNPTVEKVVANTANMVVTQPIPSNMGMTWESQHPTSPAPYLPHMQEQLSSQSFTDGGRRFAKVLQDYTAGLLDELTVKRSEKVEVLNDSANKWLVKNRMGAQGYVPGYIIEGYTG